MRINYAPVRGYEVGPSSNPPPPCRFGYTILEGIVNKFNQEAGQFSLQPV